MTAPEWRVEMPIDRPACDSCGEPFEPDEPRWLRVAVVFGWASDSSEEGSWAWHLHCPKPIQT
jgi:hypothetical protein